MGLGRSWMPRGFRGVFEPWSSVGGNRPGWERPPKDKRYWFALKELEGLGHE